MTRKFDPVMLAVALRAKYGINAIVNQQNIDVLAAFNGEREVIASFPITDFDSDSNGEQGAAWLIARKLTEKML
mgnify:FL=1